LKTGTGLAMPGKSGMAQVAGRFFVLREKEKLYLATMSTCSKVIQRVVVLTKFLRLGKN
jgi:hypothetical protein